MQVAVPGALVQIVDLASHAISEQVRLQAAKDIMDRAGLKPTERIENITVEKSTDELRKELAQLMGSVTEPGEEDAPANLTRCHPSSHRCHHLVLSWYRTLRTLHT